MVRRLTIKSQILQGSDRHLIGGELKAMLADEAAKSFINNLNFDIKNILFN